MDDQELARLRAEFKELQKLPELTELEKILDVLKDEESPPHSHLLSKIAKKKLAELQQRKADGLQS